MRILAVTNLYPSPLDPSRGTFNRLQFRALAGENSVQVISAIPWVDELVARVRRKGSLPRSRRVACDGIVVDHPRFLYTPKILRGRHGNFYWRSIRPAFERALAEFRPDLVFATWAYPDGWAAVHLGHEAGLPVVIKVHGCDVLWGLSHHPSKHQGTREALRKADAIVAVSGDLADHVVKFGVDPGRVKVVYNGIDLERFHPSDRSTARKCLGLDGSERILLCVANLWAVKGLDLLIDACARLAREGHRFKCYIVGSGPCEAQLRKQIAQRGVGETVCLLGGLPHAALPDWYRAANVFVLPSRSEGVPSVLLEAIACGTPFVATAVGGVPEVAHLGHGRLVPPDDAERLAEALAASLHAPAPTPGGTANVRSYAQGAAELTELFHSLVKHHRNTSPSPAALVGC